MPTWKLLEIDSSKENNSESRLGFRCRPVIVKLMVFLYTASTQQRNTVLKQRKVVAATIFRCQIDYGLPHAIEAYVSTITNPMTDSSVEKAIELIARALRFRTALFPD